jgi:hypothetical protein
LGDEAGGFEDQGEAIDEGGREERGGKEEGCALGSDEVENAELENEVFTVGRIGGDHGRE